MSADRRCKITDRAAWISAEKRKSRLVGYFKAAALTVAVTLLAALCLALPVSAQSPYELTDYRIDELEMDISLPVEAYVTGRSVADNFPPLERFGMTAEQLRLNYEARNIYYNALWYDDDAAVTEIVISMTTDDDIMELFDLNLASDYELEQLSALYFDYEGGASAGARYYDSSVVRNDQAVFIRAMGTVDSSLQRVNHLHYMTIVNGQRVTITLIEYVEVIDGVDPIDQSALISDAHIALMDEVIESAHWDHIRNAFFSRFRGVTVLMMVGMAGVAALVVLYGLPYIRKLRSLPDDSIVPETGDAFDEPGDTEKKDMDSGESAEKSDDTSDESQ